jgi:hypothetical protein
VCLLPATAEGSVNVRIGDVVDKDGSALAHGQYGIGLDLCVGRKDTFGQARYDRLGQVEVLNG